MLAWTARKLLRDQRTVALVGHDMIRLRARLGQRFRRVPAHSRKLHLGCGDRRVPGWLNCDVSGSECDIDLAAGRLPFPDNSSDAIVMQHVVEHLDLREQLLPLLRDLHRICADGGRVWLSCPDLAKVCTAYLDDRGRALMEDRRQRWPDYTLGGVPVQHFINDLFQARGRHRNLFDFELLSWALGQAGFGPVERIVEADLLAAHPGFPPRHDDRQSLYVVAGKAAAPHGH
ncbi:glycosyl transferase family 2 [Streptomyces sp. CB02923]|uniref:class I SAM-dependent methyltransferase n=1 Tax=Streptomyces sp. CB02923 TaxID=1718985 RepID=UPI00093AE23B|nr:methyltransferase domain-containing protein [Streptomyces sp. CB02923]OKH98993.1 glycosyl transferase family 2 [Streptomyces sp. CB02923]